MRHQITLWLGCAGLVLALSSAVSAAEPATAGASVPVGVAVIDITPAYPIRLVGYESRQAESEGIASRLKARALAIGGDSGSGGAEDGPAVLLAVDNCAVGANVTEEVAARLKTKVGLKRERLVLCSTHTHCGPGLKSALNFIFGKPIPADQDARIDRYTRELTDALEKVALQALAARAPGRLAWGQGTVGFAANRRVLKKGKWAGFGVNPNGPVDHSLPVLRVTDPSTNKVRAILVGYACHGTTLGGEFNQICGDWAGFGCDYLEREYPGAVALAIVGCGADANPEPRRNLNDSKQHGAALASEASRLLDQTSLTPLPGRITARFRRIELPLGPLPTRETLQKQTKIPGAKGFLARTLLARLDAGKSIPTSVPYPVQTWCFGDRMAMVFLGGEVVVDFALRLKWETDAQRLWVAAYSNDVPCYIPSRRVLSEGGYEADDSMVYYGHPTRFNPEVEDRVVQAVHDLLSTPFDEPRKP
jgi:hypothetical protein